MAWHLSEKHGRLEVLEMQAGDAQEAKNNKKSFLTDAFGRMHLIVRRFSDLNRPFEHCLASYENDAGLLEGKSTFQLGSIVRY